MRIVIKKGLSYCGRVCSAHRQIGSKVLTGTYSIKDNPHFNSIVFML